MTNQLLYLSTNDLVSTLPSATHHFDIDTRTGFVPPDPPISHLPVEWEPWEVILGEALSVRLQLAVKPDLTKDEMARSSSWRESVRNNLPTLSTTGLVISELFLRRAHHVLTFIMHIYIHTLPLDAEIRIPPSISIPLLEVAAHLHLPPITTYSDTTLYNWRLKSPVDGTVPPALDNLCSQHLFTGTDDEQTFYLASLRIEIRGAEALQLMRVILQDMRLGDASAQRRITAQLHRLGAIVDALTQILLDVRKGCDPEFFYHRIRPWLRGEDADPRNRRWVFEGLDDRPGLVPPTDVSGPSAGQSALIHALDIFLGLDDAHGGGGVDDARRTLLRRMRAYMPRRHRDFLRRLADDSTPLRDLVIGGDRELAGAYNDAVRAVREFRDAHIRIVVLYIVIPADRERRAARVCEETGRVPLKGTGGTHMVQFLKGVRDRTAEAVVGAGWELH